MVDEGSCKNEDENVNVRLDDKEFIMSWILLCNLCRKNVVVFCVRFCLVFLGYLFNY